MVDVQTLSIVVAAAGVFIAAINSIISSRRAEQQRQTELFMQLYNRWNTRDMAKQYGRIRYEHYIDSQDEWRRKVINFREDGKPILLDSDIYADMQSMSEFFEGIGVLIKKGLIDSDLVEDLLARRILWWWETWSPISELARKGTGDPKLHDHTEYLYNVMKKRQQLTTRL